MSRQFVKDALGWGLILWFIGYILGIILIFILSPALIGWVIMPVGLSITLWVLLKKVKYDNFKSYGLLAFVWTSIAIVFDYIFIVKAFNPSDGYYKPDVYVYYTLTFIVPLIIGWWKIRSGTKSQQKGTCQLSSTEWLRFITCLIMKNGLLLLK
jgi:hypothetical protein